MRHARAPAVTVAFRTASAQAVVALALAGCGRDAALPGDARTAPGPLVVHVTGDDFVWRIRYPGADGIHGTIDDVATTRHLHLPERTDVRIELRSRDYLYTFALPSLGLNEIAVPDLLFTLEFATPVPGTFTLRGDQMCGFSHADLIGRLVIDSHAEFKEWIARISETH